MTVSFNVVDQAWIPCTDMQGKRLELSLRSVLSQAHSLQEIRSNSSLETAALHRLLLVILHRMFGPKNISAWVNLWNQREQGFNVTQINQYLDKWQHKFDLFDPSQPFLQVADRKQLGKENIVINKMVAQLTADSTLFEHTLSDREEGAFLSFPAAARALVAIHNYGLGYKQFVDGPSAKGVVFLVRGKTLHETLLLNLICYPQEEGEFNSTQDDAPAWEMNNPFAPVQDGKVQNRDATLEIVKGKQELQYKKHMPLGYLDYLTWHNRKIKLYPIAQESLVREIAWAPGMRLQEDVIDPMQSYREHDKGRQPIVFQPDRAVWRDIDALLTLTENKKTRTIAALKQLSVVSRRFPHLLAKSYRIAAVGMAKGQAKIEFIRAESTPLPTAFLEDDKLLPDISKALKYAEDVGKLINRCTFLLAWLIHKPNTPEQKFDDQHKAFDEQQLIDNKLKAGGNNVSKDREAQQAYQLFQSFGAERLYWSGLEIQFHRLLQDLPTNRDASLENWRKQLRHAAYAGFQQAETYAGRNLRSQRAIVKAGEYFQRGLARLLEIPEFDSVEAGETTYDRNKE